MRFPGFTGDWYTKNLGQLLEFKNGINATREQYGRGFKFINVLDILNNDFLTHNNILGQVDVEEEIRDRYPVNYGDILFQRSSETREEVGSATVYLDKEHTATFGGFVIRGKKIADYDPVFLNKLLKTNVVRNNITTKSGGSTRYNVGQNTLSTTRISLPSLAEQKKISSFLSLLDERIKTQSQIIKELKVLKISLSKHIFVQKTKFLNDESVSKWSVLKLKDICKIFDGTHQTPSYVQQGVPFYSVEHLTANQFNKTKYISSEVFERENRRVKLERGDILMTRIGSIGVAKYINWNVKASFYVSLALIKNGKNIDSEYLCHFINSDSFQSELWKRTIHVAFPQKINLGEIGECLVKFPNTHEQIRISSVLSIIDKKIEIEISIYEHLNQQKNSLLKKLFI